jgi:hypothetical protein
MGGEWWPHYVIQIVPGLAWMAGPAFVSARTRRRAIAGATLTVALLLAYDAPIGAASPADAARQINQAPAVVYQAAITDYVQSITESSDPIQVVFLAPSVYASAHRRAAVPHFYFYEYRSQRKLIEDVLTAIDRRVPAAVVVVGPLFHATTGYIRKRVEGAGYIDGQHFGPVVVYRRGGQHRK